jgi:hypothetical protein
MSGSPSRGGLVDECRTVESGEVIVGSLMGLRPEETRHVALVGKSRYERDSSNKEGSNSKGKRELGIIKKTNARVRPCVT